ncbi:MAG: cobalamin biosynthesis protein CbiM [Lentisphaerae bacterium]|nr:cobalamin biosynthesis protein CbiM [Lentisphaerota bacterium]
MHMADASLSPAVGGALWAVSAGLLAHCARRVRQTLDDTQVPLMGVIGAFIFTAQMINFSIPATGSSGHLGGGLILAILLGPHAAFVTLASVLTVQALFFADGGLLALGCNIFNLGFFPAFVAYPLIFRPILGQARGGVRLWAGSVLAAVIGLQLGAFGVVLETTLSGLSDLPFRSFVLLMQPIHLAIGVAEGVATVAVVSVVQRTRPASLAVTKASPLVALNTGRAVAGFLIAAVVIGGGMSWFASTRPDGLEWAMDKIRGSEAPARLNEGVHMRLANVQERIAFLPDYDFPAHPTAAASEPARWPLVSAGTTVSGLVGGLIVLVLAGLAGYGLRRRQTAV